MCHQLDTLTHHHLHEILFSYYCVRLYLSTVIDYWGLYYNLLHVDCITYVQIFSHDYSCFLMDTVGHSHTEMFAW